MPSLGYTAIMDVNGDLLAMIIYWFVMKTQKTAVTHFHVFDAIHIQ